MRQLTIEVKRGYGGKALGIVAGHGAMNSSRMEIEGQNGPADQVVAFVPNSKVGSCIDTLQSLPDLRVTIAPRGYIPLGPPASQAPAQATDVTPRSPIEIFLSGLQSVGSWKGFLTYTFSAAAVVWVGLYANRSYLLVAAMLIAPFAGPAMNAAIATARGDWNLFKQSIIRYFASIGVFIGVSALLSILMRQSIATNMMVDISQISSVALILPLTAGIAGASNLVQSERNSLVSGAAVGMLVAASLAPPAGIVGMSLVIGRWDMALSGMFLLLLQLLGINLSGAIIFQLYGLTPEGVRYLRGKRWLSMVLYGMTILLLAGLVAGQFRHTPTLQRSSIAQSAELEIRRTVEESGIAKLVESNARFTRANISGQNTLLGEVYVQPSRETDLSSEEIRARLTRSIQERIMAKNWDATPLVHVTVLDPPGARQ